jgi:arabinogalactan oligomer/maltooligosaccharide transport system permease protein
MLSGSTKISLDRPRITFIHIAFLGLFFSFILTLWGFWAIQTILWNRIIYSNGEWANSFPIYLRTDLNVLKEMLLSNTVLFLTGLIASGVVTIAIFVNYQWKSVWSPKHRTLFIFQGVFTFLNSLMGFWIFQSIKIIASFPASGESVSGTEWIWGNIFEFSQLLTNLGLIVQFLFVVFFVFTLIVLIINRTRKETLIKESFSIYRTTLNLLKRMPFYLVIIGYLILTLLPVVVTIIVSMSSTADLRLNTLPSKPLESVIKNFSCVIFAISVSEPAFATAFIYSIILGFGTGLMGLTVSLSAGYALARFKFAGNKILTFMILATQMFPGLILLIPQYVIWKDIGLLQEELLLFGVLLAYISGAVAYCTWMMKGYFETIPIDLEEAALIDGAGRLGTFFRIAIPLAKPGMVAVLIFTFLTAWSEFVLARTFIGETAPQATLPLLFYNYQNPAAPDNPIFFELLAPYAIIVALPPVILFLLLQKELAAGAVAGGIK